MDLGTSCRPWPSDCELGLVVDPPVLSFLCFVSFVRPPGGFLVSFVLPLVSVLFFPCVYLGPLGLLAWGGVAGGLGVTPRRPHRCPCCGGSSLLFVLSFVTVGRWVIGRPLNGSCCSLRELVL